MNRVSKIDLNSFFPEDLEIVDIHEDAADIRIMLSSRTHTCVCPSCQNVSNKYHGTYIRRVQDLPILGKHVQLEINAHEYVCVNEDCPTKTIAETYGGFLDRYGRMTNRCRDFISILALETSCEGCSRICREMGIKVSGDSIIRILLRTFEHRDIPECGDVVGVDDFAFKKRHNYGTIVVDGRSHAPVAILDGRDGESLRQWLKNNKGIRVVTRDRASAYAKVISEELPDAMQIADRFHLHQNLLEAIKAALNREIPATVKIPNKEADPDEIPSETAPDETDQGKKNLMPCG